ncbi:MAG: helix-turn-helix domain-containing protein [Balneolaceae bacterium]
MQLPNGDIVLSDLSPYDLKNLIQTGEGHYLEFKRKVSTPEKLAREMAAFANTKGGTILVGVDDNGDIIGVNSFFEEEYLLSKAAHEQCVPPIPVQIELLHVADADVIVVKVPEAEVKPVYTKGKKKRTVYVRREASSLVASDELKEVLKLQHSDDGVTFEYGKHEQMLFRYLNEYGEITVSSFARLINETTYRASKILVTLVSAGILKLSIHDNVDHYSFAGNTNKS